MGGTISTSSSNVVSTTGLYSIVTWETKKIIIKPSSTILLLHNPINRFDGDFNRALAFESDLSDVNATEMCEWLDRWSASVETKNVSLTTESTRW